jgi:hypothetical protein
MAAFLSFIVSGIGGFFRIFVVLAGQRLGLATVYVALYIAAVVALATGFKTLFSSVSASVPTDSYLAAGLSLVPANSSIYVAALGTAYGLSQLYIFSQRVTKIKVTTK